MPIAPGPLPADSPERSAASIPNEPPPASGKWRSSGASSAAPSGNSAPREQASDTGIGRPSAAAVCLTEDTLPDGGGFGKSGTSREIKKIRRKPVLNAEGRQVTAALPHLLLSGCASGPEVVQHDPGELFRLLECGEVASVGHDDQ